MDRARRPTTGLNRTGKSCRLRWVNYLHPGLKRGRITPQEERLIVELHSRWGNRWSRIARKLPGRTDNEIKNYWRTHMRKKAQERKRKAATSLSSSTSYSSSSSSSGITADHPPAAAAHQNDESVREPMNGSSVAGCNNIITTTIDDDEAFEYCDLADQIWADDTLSSAAAITGLGLEECDASYSPTWDCYCLCPLWKMDDEGLHF